MRLHTKFLILFLFLLTAVTSHAMPDDRMKQLELSADKADLNERTHRGEYEGDVELDQGTTHVRATKAITEGNEKNKLTAAIAMGTPKLQAHFWTQTAADKPLLHAYADTIRYFPDRHLIELIGNARVEQGENSFSAPKISYDMLNQHVLSSHDNKQRTSIVIHPEKKKA